MRWASVKPLADTPALGLKNMKTGTLLAVCFSFVFLAFTLNLLNVQFSRCYTSDNVANQYIVQSMRSEQSSRAVLPVDSFFVHFPLYVLTDSVIHDNTRAKLFLQALILGVAGLAGVATTLLFYLKKRGMYNKTAVLLGTLTLAFIFSTPLFAEYTLEINHRLFEAGVALLLLLPAHEFLSAKTVSLNRRTVLYTALYALALGTLWFNDPYFMYIMAGGIGAVVCVFWTVRKISHEKAVAAVGVLLAGLVLTKIYGLLFARLGVRLLPNGASAIIPAGQLFANVQNAIGAFFANFNGNLFGADFRVVSLKLLVPLLSGVVLACLALAALAHSLKHSLSKVFALRTLLAGVAVALVLTITLTPIGSTPFTEDLNGRYFLLLPPLLAPLMTEYMLHLSKSKGSRAARLIAAALCAGLLVMVALNTYGATLGALHRKKTVGNSVNYGIVNAIEGAGYTKGYADYWQGPINTYLSNNRVHFLQTSCTDGIISPYHWLVNDADFSLKAARTFYILDPSLTNPSSCSLQNISQHYGAPQRVITYQGRSILLYDYDILAR